MMWIFLYNSCVNCCYNWREDLNFNSNPGEDYCENDKLQLLNPSFAHTLSKSPGGLLRRYVKIKIFEPYYVTMLASFHIVSQAVWRRQWAEWWHTEDVAGKVGVMSALHTCAQGLSHVPEYFSLGLWGMALHFRNSSGKWGKKE